MFDRIKCVGNHELIFVLITWAGPINSMLNPLIYSRFSRDFRKAFKQILTCQREKPTRKSIKTPLNIVFAQLVSITQLWEQPLESNLFYTPIIGTCVHQRVLQS
ncbi:unnamed protein product [Bursaphelenchus okinawaensis]|uniref:G_PROTEIN_RECEP_F1_2 domain-containing protein n=1 Tax=Bursaphelenchus okinawaensis TaxID=465554 RepID=A0A811KJ03_9BILA|nr:unnamed protein product [Bursaphelenchus okinawaensis]CAG9103586.1 unnamed protein product [Bursaphelenchus okinawaensis]